MVSRSSLEARRSRQPVAQGRGGRQGQDPGDREGYESPDARAPPDASADGPGQGLRGLPSAPWHQETVTPETGQLPAAVARQILSDRDRCA